MPIPLRQVEPWPDYESRQPGMFWTTALDAPMQSGDETYGEYYAHMLSNAFKASGRDYVIHLVLPEKLIWTIDLKSNNGDGWVVTGDLPNITCHPSVDTGSYHGWIRDGAITDDLEGRRR